ncbi:MAG: HAD family hydrolase [Myxococcales bacterium]|nr:HAD family hydrolase [Myxococcales bacterium]
MAPRFDKLLVLDLDETLVHAVNAPLGRMPAQQVGPYAIYHRPGVVDFLERCLASFEVGIWTASTLEYAHPVLNGLVDRDRLAFIWGRERCTLRHDPETHEYEHLKDLKKLRRRGYRREKVLFVDDTPGKIARSYGNYVRVAPYYGAHEDDELPLLADYLEHLGPAEDVRPIEKRGWQRRRRATER